MKKFIALFFILFVFVLHANSTIITHPNSKDMKVNADQIFFTGGIKCGERLFINDMEIFPNEINAFSCVFKLKNGENIFNVTTIDKDENSCTEEYKIVRQPYKSNLSRTSNLKISPQYYITNKDNVILRSTPINAGMNRLGYLPKNTYLYIDELRNEYSRVYLSKDKYGWVLTDDISISEDLIEYSPQKILSEENHFDSDIYEQTIQLSWNVPYSVSMNDDELKISIYNLNTSNECEEICFKVNDLIRYTIKEENNTISIVLNNYPIKDKKIHNKRIKIVIDAGHGGEEKGAIGCLGDMEKDINLEIAENLKKILESKKYDVIMTRENDKYISLKERTEIAKEKDALFFVSIHLNSVPINQNPIEHTGSTVFYYNNNCKEFAESVANNLSQALSVKNNGIKQASFAVIRPTEYLGILTEVVYMVNPNDTIVYKNNEFAQKAAEGISKGIEKYLKNVIENKNK